MPETTIADADTILELHRQFAKANTREDVVWLEAHTYPDVTWYNRNKSNFMSQEAILGLWRRLHEARPDKSKDAPLRTFNEIVTVAGDAAWVVYMIEVEYDFGDLQAKRRYVARSTEIWRKTDTTWKLAHFHCSEHEPGVLGGE